MVQLTAFYLMLYIHEILVLTIYFFDICVVLPFILVTGIIYRFFSLDL